MKTKALSKNVAVVNKVMVPKVTSATFTHRIDDDDDDDMTGYISSSKGSSKFQFSIRVEDVPFCCGISELGRFDIDDDNKTIPRSEKVKLVRDMLHRICDNNTEGRECRTLMFTTVNNDACAFIDEAVKDGSMFTLVKTFTNSNSSKVNRLYISNN